MSAAIPGLGQFAQGRPVAGVIQFLAVVTYMFGAVTLGGWKPALLALLWNAFSSFDAWRHDRK
jgi:TM2 domain-containing membrane protein YozV